MGDRTYTDREYHEYVGLCGTFDRCKAIESVEELSKLLDTTSGKEFLLLAGSRMRI